MTNERNNEIVRKVIDGLRAQGGYSYLITDGEFDSCLYRSGDKRCAAGLLMPDDTDFEALEGNPLSCPKHMLALSRGGIVDDDEIRLVTRLQSIHDSNAEGGASIEVCLGEMVELLK